MPIPETSGDAITHAPSPSATPPHNPALLSFLGKFLHGANPQKVAHPGWDHALGKPARQVVDHLQRAGWLIEAPLHVKLGCGHTVAGLKPELKARGLAVSGKKDQLIHRLLIADPQGAALLASAHPIWCCSEPAAAAARAYEEDRAQRQETAQRNALTALFDNRVPDAVRAIVAFECTEVMPRGLGFDWTLESTAKHLEEQVHTILSLTPKILEDIDPRELPSMRALAAMLALTGQNHSKQWLTNKLKGHPHLELEVAVRMLLFAGTHARELRQYARSGIKNLRVRHMGEFSCQACSSFGARVYSVTAAPELPHPKCTHEMGCRCGYEPIVEFK